ncbi:B-cell lymphoma 3 protein homolog [Cheilinus undulatus]|uniref:B-cell lymphoma 3 protein homolog n=1 Tax=Cheilinus undulatus TaxID=241271 RepID=UPI001BD3EE25|nr:B-cell lymphoma 3 protein homolog [Cheilinus undulatus]
MPRIMTMNGDHQSVATAPLDLRTSNRERGTTDCKGRVGDARVTSGSPAPPSCTGMDTGMACQLPQLTRCPTGRVAQGSKNSPDRKRPADDSSLRLPFRKRPIPVELETQSQSPAPADPEDRLSPVVETDVTSRISRLERVEDDSRIVAGPVIPRQFEETRQSHNGYPIFLRYFEYGIPMYCLPPIPEPSHTVILQTENLLSGIAVATRQDEDGDTALHIAVVQEEQAIVCKLIQLLQLAHRSLDIYNNLRQTPLHLAVITQQAKMVEALLSAGADPTTLDRNGQTALHLCCEYDQHDCLSVVLSSSLSSACLEIRNFEGLSPLHLAVLRGRKDLAGMLLDAGADINAMDIKSGQSPVMHAVESNNADMVHFLIERGCDVNSQSYSGNTALHSACGRGQVDTVRLLLKSGADSSLKNYHNDTPVMVAKNKKISDVLRGRGSVHIKVQDQHSVSNSPYASSLTEIGSPSPNHSRGCSPSTTPQSSHHSNSHSPKTPSTLVFPYF